MKALTPFLFLAVLATPLALSAKITRTVEKTFAVQPGGNLKASTQGGDITIKTGDTPEVHVVVKQVIRASSEKEADDILAKLDLTLEQSGNDVTLEAKYERQGMGSWFGNWPPVNVSFVVTVPKNFNVNLNTSGGNIEVASLTGTVRGRTSGGNLRFARIEGDIDAHTSGGDISLHSVAQLINASTSGGNVRAVITEPLKQDANLSTSGGNVDVRIAKGSGFHLDASTSGGDVHAEGITITIEKGGSGKSRLVGSVNGGGPNLRLRTSGGDIHVATD